MSLALCRTVIARETDRLVARASNAIFVTTRRQWPFPFGTVQETHEQATVTYFRCHASRRLATAKDVPPQ